MDKDDRRCHIQWWDYHSNQLRIGHSERQPYCRGNQDIGLSSSRTHLCDHYNHSGYIEDSSTSQAHIRHTVVRKCCHDNDTDQMSHRRMHRANQCCDNRMAYNLQVRIDNSQVHNGHIFVQLHSACTDTDHQVSHKYPTLSPSDHSRMNARHCIRKIR